MSAPTPKPPRMCRYCDERAAVRGDQYCDRHGGRDGGYGLGWRGGSVKEASAQAWTKTTGPPVRGRGPEHDDYSEESSP